MIVSRAQLLGQIGLGDSKLLTDELEAHPHLLHIYRLDYIIHAYLFFCKYSKKLRIIGLLLKRLKERKTLLFSLTNAP